MRNHVLTGKEAQDCIDKLASNFEKEFGQKPETYAMLDVAKELIEERKRQLIKQWFDNEMSESIHSFIQILKEEKEDNKPKSKITKPMI